MQYYMLMAKRVFWNTRNIMLAVLLAAIAASIWLIIWVQGRQTLPLMVYAPSAQSQAAQDALKAEDDSVDEYKDWGICKDPSDGISFRYPTDWEQPNIPENYCSSVPFPGAIFGLASPKSVEDTYLFRVQYTGGIDSNDLKVADGTQGQKVLDVVPLDVAGAKKQLFVVTFADLQHSSDAWAMTLTDQHYTVGQVVEYVARPINQTDGKAFELTANLAESPSQNMHGTYPLSDYKDHPYYSTVLKIFKSIQVLQ